ncbi:hypothetical protein FB451DRAFT_1555910 [Mycena latifolia]|nr:hypothetical protein FB451DRAFT_1555910 [Mycena latifolia]
MASLSLSVPPPAFTPAPGPSSAVCKLCNRQLARYTCPTCNAPYCALACFRSPAHAACSEAFYKKEVEADIRSAPGKSGKERARMMGLLRRFEEESAAREGGVPPDEPDEGEEEDEDADGDALARRLQRVDLDSTSPSALWALLPPSLRARFLKTMADPQSALAQELLSSEALALAVTPWWTPHSALGTRLPEPIEVPAALKGAPSGSGKGLVYNIASVLIAYAYTTRHLGRSPLAAPVSPSPSPFRATDFDSAPADANTKPNTGDADSDTDADPDPDPDTPAARALMAHLVPFLTERASTTRHPTLDSALTALRSRLPDDVPLAPLLRDAAVLLRPAPVLVISPSSSSPSFNASPNTDTADPADAPDALHADTPETAEPDQTAHPSARALGDLRALFLASPSSSLSPSHAASSSHPRPKHTHVAHKLAFYAASLQAPGGEGEARARAVAAEMEGAAGVEEREAEARGERDAEVDGPMGKVGVKLERTVGIEELGEGAEGIA